MSRLTLASYITLIHTLNKPSSFCNEFQQLCVIFSALLNNLRKSLQYLKQSPFFRTTAYCRRSSNRSVVAEKWSVSAVDEQLQKTSEDPGNGNTVVMRHDYELVTKTKRPTSNVWKVLANTLLLLLFVTLVIIVVDREQRASGNPFLTLLRAFLPQGYIELPS